MSNLEKNPPILQCQAQPAAGASLLEPRDIALGGGRSFDVRRTLPQAERSMIGPWCYLDHFGPDDVETTGAMATPRHPHAGMATLTVLFCGEVDHVDSTGVHTVMSPGTVTLMIAGRGVTHSEFSTAQTNIVHGVQLWYALPDKNRYMPAKTQQHTAEALFVDDCKVTVFLGSFGSVRSPLDPVVDALAAQLDIYGTAEFELHPHYEHGLLLDRGEALLTLSDGTELAVHSDELAYIPPGTQSVRIYADEPTRLMLIGGRPFGEDIVMWWNFVGRDLDEIERLREEYAAEVSEGEEHRDTVFGPFPEGTPPAIVPPPVPQARLARRS